MALSRSSPSAHVAWSVDVEKSKSEPLDAELRLRSSSTVAATEPAAP
eukprot:CAMPEP_0168469806 /NCGR_PEP_ID=MMETSP0228-20121227/58407_1 /TAXON_ID=133427 /ORGANISM="Protoceratium reticulatum, Strain CCCM 535 (=CCMP 1889)" /LENGTH=46 /DNA_ID= /DNA_START= /DNA_END= /DNA_ORIENTATION=